MEEHQSLHSRIEEVFKQEISTSSPYKGRILEIFGGELWYRITLELINKYFKNNYRRYIQENLDTEGKSKQLFLEILDLCIGETRKFFARLKDGIFRDNALEIENSELEIILSLLFSDFQKLYQQKEIVYLEKTCNQFYQGLIDQIKAESMRSQA
jgi:hypothetical protein